MRRSIRVGVGLVGAVAAVSGARWVTDHLVPAGARGLWGAVAHATTLAQAARRELAAGTAEREAELRADLLAGADLTRSRVLVEAWRAERSERARAAESAEAGDDSPGRTAAAGTGPDARSRPGRSRSDLRRPEDPDDGPLGYSFF